jgi:ABC-type multidrug transport system fused ATPase/permease subunit
MRLSLYAHLQRLSPRFYARTRLGDIVARLNNDISEIQRVAAEAALAWVGNVLFLIGSLVMMAVARLAARPDRPGTAADQPVRPAVLPAEARKAASPSSQRAPTSAAFLIETVAGDVDSSSPQHAAARTGSLPRPQRRLHRRR